jgi:[ribosomal protein S5]-alanine N-acetyltransferase
MTVNAAHSLLPPQRTLPSLTTPRLILRAMTLADLDDVFAYAKDPEVLRYTTGTTPQDPEETEEFLEDAVAAKDGRIWAIQLRDRTTVIGAIEFSLLSIETGATHYVLGRPYWGQGLMTEAARAVCDWAFGALPAMLEIKTAAVEENVGSIRVLEKTGFSRIDTIIERWEKQPEPVRLAIFRRTRPM